MWESTGECDQVAANGSKPEFSLSVIGSGNTCVAGLRLWDYETICVSPWLEKARGEVDFLWALFFSLTSFKEILTTNGYTHFSDEETEDQWKCVNGKASIWNLGTSWAPAYSSCNCSSQHPAQPRKLIHIDIHWTGRSWLQHRDKRKFPFQSLGVAFFESLLKWLHSVFVRFLTPAFIHTCPLGGIPHESMSDGFPAGASG